jgi:ADP-heptose:LPS heptosyltransferase
MSYVGSSIDRPPLVVRFGAFGDMVLLTVLLRQLYARFGKRVDVISSGPWTKPLLEGQESLGRLTVIRSRRTPYLLAPDQRQLVAWLRERGAGPTWFCDVSRGKDLLHRGGIPEPYICSYSSFTWSPDENFADRFIRMARETPAAFQGVLPPPVPTVSRDAQLVISDEARASADEWLAQRRLADRPFVVIHPGSAHIARRAFRSPAGTDRYWPEDRWGKVINLVRDLRPGHTVLLTGTKAERKFNDAIIATSGAKDVYNAANELSIRTLLPLLERAHSMISIDTGPAHAAAALRRPTVAVFGKQNSILFRPGGPTTPAVAVTGLVDGVQDIMGITPEAVIAAWLELIRSTETPANHSVNSLSRGRTAS